MTKLSAAEFRAEIQGDYLDRTSEERASEEREVAAFQVFADRTMTQQLVYLAKVSIVVELPETIVMGDGISAINDNGRWRVLQNVRAFERRRMQDNPYSLQRLNAEMAVRGVLGIGFSEVESFRSVLLKKLKEADITIDDILARVPEHCEWQVREKEQNAVTDMIMEVLPEIEHRRKFRTEPRSSVACVNSL